MQALFGVNNRLLDASLLLVRIGLAFVFVFAGAAKLMNPMMAEMLGLPGGLFGIIAVLEILSAIGILLGLLTRPSAVFQIVILLGAIFVVAGGNIGNPQLPGVWKDPGLLTISVFLLLYGPGRFSVDAWLGDRLVTRFHRNQTYVPMKTTAVNSSTAPQYYNFPEPTPNQTHGHLSLTYCPGTFCIQCGMRLEQQQFCPSCGKPKEVVGDLELVSEHTCG